ncbi:hypothetical protein D3C73_817500 [compost metagenome]
MAKKNTGGFIYNGGRGVLETPTDAGVYTSGFNDCHAEKRSQKIFRRSNFRHLFA